METQKTLTRHSTIAMVLIGLAALAIGQTTETERPKDGTYTYAVAFAEWNGKTNGATCTVIISGDSIKVVHNGNPNLSGKKGSIIDQGIIMKHAGTGKWIIGHTINDKNAKEVNGCEGQTIVDFKKKLIWSC